MAKTLTLKNLPDALHARLTAAARRHRRSLNNEAIVCLEAGLGADPSPVEQQLAQIQMKKQERGFLIFYHQQPVQIQTRKQELEDSTCYHQ